MDNTLYNSFKTAVTQRHDDHFIYGQIFTVLSKTQSGLTTTAKKAGYLKVSLFQARIYKAESVIEKINTSTGMVDAGLTYTAKRESYYVSEGLNGLFSALKSNEDKKYLEIYFTESDENFKSQSIFVSPNGDIITDENELATIKEKPCKQSAAYEISGVKIRQFSWENLIYVKIAGNTCQDNNLIDIINYFK